MKQINVSSSADGWVVLGELPIASGTLLFADPTNFVDAARIDGIPPALYRFYAQSEKRCAEFGPSLRRIHLRVRPGSIDTRVRALNPTTLHFPGSGAGIAVAIDEHVYKEHWLGFDHCHQVVSALLSPHANREVVLDNCRARVLVVDAYSLPIELSEAIDSSSLPIRLREAVARENMDTSDEITVVTQMLYGKGELRGVDFTFW